MGDPSGIGPEVTLKSLASPQVKGLADFLIIGDRLVLERTNKDLGLKIDVPVLDLANVRQGTFSYGKSKSSYGRASVQYIDKALALLGAGKARALVTAPVNKSSINKAGYSHFRGHTEYLARRTGTKDFAMLFAGKDLKIALVTRHLALNKVAKSLSEDGIYKTIMLTHRYLKNYFGIKNPRIAVCGLNPHAGEGSLLGSEERDIIEPAIKRARKAGDIYGPVPSDTVFYEALKKKYDAVVSMYHDQALGPFKMLYFTSGVNLTIGLPFIRTSPDHGTAFNIAGKGIADPESMTEAIKLACSLRRS